MKKTLALLLALCMLFGLTACGGTDSTPTTANVAASGNRSCRYPGY